MQVGDVESEHTCLMALSTACTFLRFGIILCSSSSFPEPNRAGDDKGDDTGSSPDSSFLDVEIP